MMNWFPQLAQGGLGATGGVLNGIFDFTGLGNLFGGLLGGSTPSPNAGMGCGDLFGAGGGDFLSQFGNLFEGGNAGDLFSGFGDLFGGSGLGSSPGPLGGLFGTPAPTTDLFSSLLDPALGVVAPIDQAAPTTLIPTNPLPQGAAPTPGPANIPAVTQPQGVVAALDAQYPSYYASQQAVRNYDWMSAESGTSLSSVDPNFGQGSYSTQVADTWQGVGISQAQSDFLSEHGLR